MGKHLRTLLFDVKKKVFFPSTSFAGIFFYEKNCVYQGERILSRCITGRWRFKIFYVFKLPQTEFLLVVNYLWQCGKTKQRRGKFVVKWSLHNFLAHFVPTIALRKSNVYARDEKMRTFVTCITAGESKDILSARSWKALFITR